MLFTVQARATPTSSEASVEVLQLQTGETKTLVRRGHNGRWVASGHLLYAREGTIYAAPMDLARLELTGPAVPVVEAVASDAITGYTAFEVSHSGTLAFVKGKNAEVPLHWCGGSGGRMALRPFPHVMIQSHRQSNFHWMVEVGMVVRNDPHPGLNSTSDLRAGTGSATHAPPMRPECAVGRTGCSTSFLARTGMAGQ